MHSTLAYWNPVLFAVLPYVAFFIFFLVTIQRYRAQSYTYSSLSTQLLENQQHFWSEVPFHYGIIAILAAHTLAFFIPRGILLWNRAPLRLYALEITGLVLALLALLGLLSIVARRVTNPKISVVTSASDWIVYTLLLVQVTSGIGIALFYPWGSSWFAAAAVPYLWSLVKFNPDLSAVSALPLLAKIHIANTYLLIGFFPFSRLVHILVVPNPYLWRKPQVVRWYWNRKTIRNAE